MPTSRWQPAFSAGVVGPALHGRMDLDKYDLALKVGENVIVHAHGGVSNRAGTEYIGTVSSATGSRLIPFERSATENYMLVFGNRTLRVIQDGAFVQSGGVIYVITSPFTTADLDVLTYAQSIDVMYFANGGLPRKLLHFAAASWQFDTVSIVPDLDRPSVTLSKTDSNEGTQNEWVSYKVSGVIDGVEGYPSSAVGITVTDMSYRGSEVLVQWSVTQYADYYNVYKQRGASYGYVGYAEDGTSGFTDKNIAPDMTLAPIEEPDFTANGEYPYVVGLFQQRLIYANSPNYPETIWFSQLGDYENFSKSEVLRATDSFEMDVTGMSLNRIKHLLPLRELLVFGAGGEWSLTGPDGGISATNTAQRQFGYSGCGDVAPIVVENTALFVDRSGRQVRDLRYAFEQDGYSGNDLTIFAYHFFEGRSIASWAYAKVPYSIIWVALDNGTLLSLTYKREHGVWAWATHDVGGSVLDVAVIREGTDDSLYMIVEREIGGVTVRYIERMTTRQDDTLAEAYFVDCGVTYTSVGGQSNWTFPDWLDEDDTASLAVLADGVVITDFTVNAGVISTSVTANTFTIGLKFTSEIETLPPAIELKDVGNARGRPIKASKAYLQVEKTAGIKFGPTRDKLHAYTAQSGLVTGTIEMTLYPDWNREGNIVVRQDQPLPMTILGIAPDYSIGRTSG